MPWIRQRSDGTYDIKQWEPTNSQGWTEVEDNDERLQQGVPVNTVVDFGKHVYNAMKSGQNVNDAIVGWVKYLDTL